MWWPFVVDSALTLNRTPKEVILSAKYEGPTAFYLPIFSNSLENGFTFQQTNLNRGQLVEESTV